MDTVQAEEEAAAEEEEEYDEDGNPKPRYGLIRWMGG